jgi:hypothetical protein
MTAKFSHSDMAHELAKLIYGKVDWLSRFSEGRDKRSDPEIELKRRELAVLEQAKDDYERAAERAD